MDITCCIKHWVCFGRDQECEDCKNGVPEGSALYRNPKLWKFESKEGTMLHETLFTSGIKYD